MNKKYLSILLSTALVSQIGGTSQISANGLYNKTNILQNIELNQMQGLKRNNKNDIILDNKLEDKIIEAETTLNRCMDSSSKLSVKEIDKICNKSIELLKNESCLIRISGPTIIVGDIHGDIQALSFCVKTFLREIRSGKSILFLGDYVDRGKNSVECSYLILKLKVLFPNKVFLLRGNHEIRKAKSKQTRDRYIGSQYGFLAESRKKYNNEDHVFKKINEVFDYMSIAATIDDSAFCVHGGISPELNDLNQINELKKPISYEDLSKIDNRKEENLIMDLLWSDPNYGNKFESNQKRGRGKLFGHKQVLEFLNKFNFKHIIRGHQCVEDGYDDKFKDGSIITIFSVPNYVRKSNKGAIIDYTNENNFEFKNIVY